jgi:hypothetical protein
VYVVITASGVQLRTSTSFRLQLSGTDKSLVPVLQFLATRELEIADEGWDFPRTAAMGVLRPTRGDRPDGPIPSGLPVHLGPHFSESSNKCVGAVGA